MAILHLEHSGNCSGAKGGVTRVSACGTVSANNFDTCLILMHELENSDGANAGQHED